MSAERPNHIRFHRGETSFGESFGAVANVTPIHFAGLGHTPHLQVRMVGGLMLDFTPEAFQELLREGQAALSQLPAFPDIRDHVGEES